MRLGAGNPAQDFTTALPKCKQREVTATSGLRQWRLQPGERCPRNARRELKGGPGGQAPTCDQEVPAVVVVCMPHQHLSRHRAGLGGPLHTWGITQKEEIHSSGTGCAWSWQVIPLYGCAWPQAIPQHTPGLVCVSACRQAAACRHAATCGMPPPPQAAPGHPAAGRSGSLAGHMCISAVHSQAAALAVGNRSQSPQ